MPNPTGQNQQPYTLQPQYGQIKKQTQLLKEAPISGSPIAAQALNAPRRASQGAKRSRRAAAQAPPPLPPQTPTAQASNAQLWQQIARIPGTSPLVQQYAQEAQSVPAV